MDYLLERGTFASISQFDGNLTKPSKNLSLALDKYCIKNFLHNWHTSFT